MPATDSAILTATRVYAKIIFIVPLMLLVLLLLLCFIVYYNQPSYFLPLPVIKEGLSDLESMQLSRRKCERCLIAYRNDQGVVNSSGITETSVINVACSECRERVRLFECDRDILITVKTAWKYHNFRLSLLLFTWMQTVDPDQVMTSRTDHNIILFLTASIKIYCINGNIFNHVLIPTRIRNGKCVHLLL